MARRVSTACVAGVVLACLACDVVCTAATPTRGRTTTSGRAAEPLVQPALLPLPPGAVEPRGWLRDWALAARNGITGHLDEWHPTFRDGWKGVPIEGAPYAEPDGTGWALEQSAYWLDGCIRLGLVLHDDWLIAKARARLDPIVDGVLRRKSTLIFWKDPSILQSGKKEIDSESRPGGFNSWAHSHMARALLAYYQGTGNKRILDALTETYRHFSMEDPAADFETVYGIVNLDPMLEVFGLTGDRSAYETAISVARRTSFRKMCEQWWPQTQERYGSGHGVLFIEQARVPAVLYPWTGDPWMLNASLKAFHWAEQRHMLPCGVPSSEEYLAGIGAFRCIESCDIPCWIWSQVRLLRILGDGSFADSVEIAFFNAGPAPIARDWQTMCYYQSPNRINDVLPSARPGAPHGPGSPFCFTKLGYPPVLCCVGNINRLIPNYVIHMWMATPDNGLAATLYGPCTATAIAGDNVPVKLICETAYPFEETIRVKVEPDRTATFPLYFRIPKWCVAPRIRTELGTREIQADKHGFVKLERKWLKGDTVRLDFPMPVRILRGRETPYPQISYFTRTGSKVKKVENPFISVYCGPLLFALPIPDKDANTPVEGATWQYALDFDGSRNVADFACVRQSMPDKWSWQLDSPLALQAPARYFDWHPTDAQALPSETIRGGGPATVRLVPYGSTKFRISMFPATPKAWDARAAVSGDDVPCDLQN